MSDDEVPKLGPCCICGSEADVKSIVMLPHRAPTAGRGWGCAVCGRPADGAMAVVCDHCLGRPVRFVCDGYPGEGRRVPIESVLDTRFDHDMRKHHPDDAGGDGWPCP
jgi:hypothetical protein